MRTVGDVRALAVAITARTGESAPNAATIADTQPPEFEALPAVSDGRLSPGGEQLAINRGTELCIVDLSDTAASEQGEPMCAPADGEVYAASMAWSPDGSRVLFHHDPFTPPHRRITPQSAATHRRMSDTLRS